MSEVVDIFEDPAFILSPDFDPYRCSVLGIKIGASADELKDWDGEPTSANWFHIEGGVAFQVKDYEICKIKLPQTILARLKIQTVEDLIAHLGKNDDIQEMLFREQLRHSGYLWNKGIYAFWQIRPEFKPHHLAIFNPIHGFEQMGEATFSLLLAQDCLERQPVFQMLPFEEKESLKPGDAAKLIFDIRINSKSFTERMWVEVREVKPEFYEGLLASDTYCTHDFKRGMPVQFHAGHVIQIRRKESAE